MEAVAKSLSDFFQIKSQKLLPQLESSTARQEDEIRIKRQKDIEKATKQKQKEALARHTQLEAEAKQAQVTATILALEIKLGTLNTQWTELKVSLKPLAKKLNRDILDTEKNNQKLPEKDRDRQLLSDLKALRDDIHQSTSLPAILQTKCKKRTEPETLAKELTVHAAALQQLYENATQKWPNWNSLIEKNHLKITQLLARVTEQKAPSEAPTPTHSSPGKSGIEYHWLRSASEAKHSLAELLTANKDHRYNLDNDMHLSILCLSLRYHLTRFCHGMSKQTHYGVTDASPEQLTRYRDTLRHHHRIDLSQKATVTKQVHDLIDIASTLITDNPLSPQQEDALRHKPADPLATILCLSPSFRPLNDNSEIKNYRRSHCGTVCKPEGFSTFPQFIKSVIFVAFSPKYTSFGVL